MSIHESKHHLVQTNEQERQCKPFLVPLRHFLSIVDSQLRLFIMVSLTFLRVKLHFVIQNNHGTIQITFLALDQVKQTSISTLRVNS